MGWSWTPTKICKQVSKPMVYILFLINALLVNRVSLVNKHRSFFFPWKLMLERKGLQWHVVWCTLPNMVHHTLHEGHDKDFVIYRYSHFLWCIVLFSLSLSPFINYKLTNKIFLFLNICILNISFFYYIHL